MTRRRNIFLGAALTAPLAALAIAGCGGSNDAVKASTPAATKAGGKSGGATVDLRATKLGKVLVDAQGRTLYLFEKDKGTTSTCFGACASVWPPFTTSGKPKAGPGVSASMLGTTARSDGRPEVTYNGHPLYYYAADQKPGDTTGQNLDQFGAEWDVLGSNGKKVDND